MLTSKPHLTLTLTPGSWAFGCAKLSPPMFSDAGLVLATRSQYNTSLVNRMLPFSPPIKQSILLTTQSFVMHSKNRRTLVQPSNATLQKATRESPSPCPEHGSAARTLPAAVKLRRLTHQRWGSIGATQRFLHVVRQLQTVHKMRLAPRSADGFFTFLSTYRFVRVGP